MTFSSVEIENLFRQHYQMLSNISYRILDDKNSAEDIVQDVFIQILSKSDKININSSAKGYLIRSVTNASINYLQANKNTLSIGLEKAQPVVTFTGYEKMAKEELEIEINKAINRLPAQCKAIFILSRYEEMKYKEIAAHLELSVKTVENQMGKALEKLRESLKPHLTKEFSSLAI